MIARVEGHALGAARHTEARKVFGAGEFLTNRRRRVGGV